MKKAYIILNHLKGWKVVLDGRNVNCTKPIFNSRLTNNKGLEICKKFCKNNNIEVIRICQ